MPFRFNLPDIGEGITEGDIETWLVKPGDEIKEDDPLLEIQNDKSMVEIPSPVTGKVLNILVPEGATATVGDTLVEIESDADGDETITTTTNESTEPTVEVVEPATEPVITEVNQVSDRPIKNDATLNSTPMVSAKNPGKLILAMPSVRQKARDLGIDLTAVNPTGKHAHITLTDLTNTANDGNVGIENEVTINSESTTVSPQSTMVLNTEATTTEKMSPVRKIIAKQMTESKQTIPHVTIFDEVEVTNLMNNRKKYKEIAQEKGIKLTFLPYVVKALVAVLKQYPDFNSMVDMTNKEIIRRNYINVGIATDTDHGLYVPNIKNANAKNMFEIASEISENTQAAIAETIAPETMKNGSITITNIGSIGGGLFTPVINAPEVAILGLGKISKEPIVNEQGNIEVGQVMKLSLSFDHRIIDGAQAQKAMNLIKQLLNDPDRLLMEG